MIKRKGSFKTEIRERMREGAGSAKIEHLWLPQEELGAKSMRLCAKVVLEPGCGIGSHPHNDEEEVYFILSGEAEFEEGGKTTILKPGDTSLTGNGGSHAIKCHGDKTLEFMAIVTRF